MTQFNPISGRTTTLMSSNQLLSAVRRSQIDLLERQSQISTGVKVGKPSDAPSDASSIQSLQRALEAREQHEGNLQFALTILNNTDTAIGDATGIIQETKSIASSQIGVGSSAETRETMSHLIDAQIQAMVDIANRSVQGVALFGGRHSSTADGQVFVNELGGVRYIGSTEDLAGDVGLDRPLAFNANGGSVFGALSARVKGQVDLDPQATTATPLTDLNGAQASGIRKGTIVVNTDSTTINVDLTDADTMGDVVTRINEAINTVDPTAGSIAIGTNGFSLTANAGHTISITNVGTGQTASDLGIAISAVATTVNGADVGPRLTELTSVAALGVAVDLVNGLNITHGSKTKVADFSAATNIQDMINVVDQLDLGLRLEINAAGTGLDIISEISGIELSVGENAGGTTADDLGIRSFGVATELKAFHHGLGVSSITGADDFRFQLHDGSTFNVNIDGVNTVTELVNTIQTAAATAGLTVGTPGTGGTDFNIGLATNGNGMLFEDGTTGVNDFQVQQLGLSLAATDLGIYTNAGTGNSIQGQDVATVRVESVFTHLISLRDALVLDDTRGITFAGEGIENDIKDLTRARADVGVRAQRVEQQQQRSADLKITEQTFLSELRDTELTEAISNFTALQQQLQASLLVGSQNLQLSLLNFLR